MAFFDIKPFAGVTVEAAEGYDESYAGMQSLIEGYQNDYKLFTAALYNDIKEYSMVHEGASVEDVMALQEASISGFFEKIKEFFKKLWAKVKAIFKGFIAKFDSMFMKSGKALVKKYKADIEKKDTTNLEVKFSKKKFNFDAFREGGLIVAVHVGDVDDVKKAVEDFDSDDYACKVAKDCVPSLNLSSMSDFDKDFHEVAFEDPDDMKWSEISGEVYATLEDEKLVKEVQKTATKFDAAIAGIIKAIDKDRNNYDKKFKSETEHEPINVAYSANSDDSSGSGSSSKVTTFRTDAPVKNKEAHLQKQAALTLLSKRASATQVAINKFTAAVVREAKFHASQCRAAIAKAVAYRPKSEMTELDTIADAVAYDPTVLL